MTTTSKEVEVYEDYLFVAFSGTENIRIYSLIDYSLIATINVETIHGSSIQFSNEFYDASDEFPLLYVGGWHNNKINVIRIYKIDETWTASVIKTLTIPNEYGYYASPSIDNDNNHLIVYAHSNRSLPNSDNMIISIFDLSTLITNDDGTYTPKFISKCFSPSTGTFQGHKYYGGKLYLTSTNSTSPYKPRIYAIDCGSGNIETRIDVSIITGTETEGLCYKIDGTKILWYLTDYHNVFELQF